MRSNTSNAKWTGNLKEGKGIISSTSGALNKVPYDYCSRFEDGTLTNPEELIAAAHAACYSMHLSEQIEKAGAKIDMIETKATVTIDKNITESKLETRVKATGIDQKKFEELANYSKDNCPVSKVLSCKKTLVKAEFLTASAQA